MQNRTGLFILIAATLITLAFGAADGPAAAQGASWYGEYFANQNLSGSPILTRYDGRLAFDWGNGGPGGGVPNDGFSVRWTIDTWFETGTYRFSYRSDDGIRIWVDDVQVVDDWRDRQATWSLVDRAISRGVHRVRVEYYEHGGSAIVQVEWERMSGGHAWRAEYFSNRDLTGSPTLVRDDIAIDFDWEYGSPDSAVPADDFSVRWTSTLGFTPGTYRFYASCDDGVRVYVDGHRVVDAWYNQQLPNTRTGDITLGDGEHTVVVEYYERGGEASAHVWWNLLTTFGGWQGRYYDNLELRGGPALIRDDLAIEFDWGEGAPADWMPADGFSVVWTRQIDFAPGYYRFNVRSDDGVRVWIDAAIVMDYWRPQDYAWHYLDGTYLDGIHTIRVEYFEQAGGARIHFWYEPTGTTLPVTPPSAPAPPSSLPGPWRGEYYNNPDLTGSPILVRSDAAIDFNWSFDAPVPWMNRDEFAVRWTGTFLFEAGRYRFTTTTDDGVRIYVDDRLVLSSWRPMRGTRTGYATLAQGSHTVRVEYFERTQAAMAHASWERTGATADGSGPSPRQRRMLVAAASY